MIPPLLSCESAMKTTASTRPTTDAPNPGGRLDHDDELVGEPVPLVGKL